ncbi:MAG: DVUA0089 family protein [Phycisphaerales bacterium]|nr:DVUA0089 family protein [Phycisphaerales bacterium]
MKKLMALTVAMLSGSAALAADWAEVGEAGELLSTANITVGVGALTGITGTLNAGTEDLVDMYCIRIPDPSIFGATTVGGASFDTQLFLFDANGRGVTFNDDAASSGTLQSTITGQFVPAPGIYFLAISRFDRDPVDANEAALWLDTPFNTERAPDGPGAANPLLEWSGGGGSAGSYRIELRNAAFHVPEPASLSLLALGALAMRRRR